VKPPRYLTHFSRVGSAVAAIPARFIACIAVLCLVMCSTAPLRAEILVTQLSSSTGGNGNILHYDDSGNFLGVLIPNLQVPESAEFGTDGKLYVPEFSGNRVLRFLADGTPDGVFCSPPGPAAIAFDAAGMAYVYLPSFGVIHRFDSDGTLQGALVFPYGPGYTRMGPDGYLYTASWVGNNVSA